MLGLEEARKRALRVLMASRETGTAKFWPVPSPKMMRWRGTLRCCTYWRLMMWLLPTRAYRRASSPSPGDPRDGCQNAPESEKARPVPGGRSPDRQPRHPVRGKHTAADRSAPAKPALPCREGFSFLFPWRPSAPYWEISRQSAQSRLPGAPRSVSDDRSRDQFHRMWFTRVWTATGS